MEFPVVEIPKRLNEIPVVDSENTLTNFTTLQQQLINNNKSESIICLEKTTTHHSFYDVEKLAGDNIVNNSSMSTTAASGDRVSSRLLGMGNPAIIANWGFATITLLMALHKLILPAGSNHLMLPTALWYGGLAQFISGFLVLLNGDSFNGTLFVTFGAYWLGSGLIMVPSVGESLNVYAATNDTAKTTAIYLFLWAFFGLMVCVISLKIKDGSFLSTWCLFFIFLNLFLEACYNLTGIVSLMEASGAACLCASFGGYYSGIVDIFAEQGVYLWTGKYTQQKHRS